MDLLEAAGDGSASTAEFWRALSQAAANMGLHDRADHFFQRIGQACPTSRRTRHAPSDA